MEIELNGLNELRAWSELKLVAGECDTCDRLEQEKGTMNIFH